MLLSGFLSAGVLRSWCVVFSVSLSLLKILFLFKICIFKIVQLFMWNSLVCSWSGCIVLFFVICVYLFAMLYRTQKNGNWCDNRHCCQFVRCVFCMLVYCTHEISVFCSSVGGLARARTLLKLVCIYCIFNQKKSLKIFLSLHAVQCVLCIVYICMFTQRFYTFI